MTTDNHHKMQFFKDKDGKTVLWQWPNIPIYGWLGFKLLSFLIHTPHLKSSFDNISMAFLFTWAYLEITEGVNYFRRLLGLLVLLSLLYGYFK